MSLLKRDTVTVDRKVKTGTTDALGHPVTTSATGYPKTNIVGYFSDRSSIAKETDAALDKTINAVFYTYSFSDWCIGDIVTKSGVDYVVDDISIKYKADGVFDHARCGLILASIGSENNGS